MAEITSLPFPLPKRGPMSPRARRVLLGGAVALSFALVLAYAAHSWVLEDGSNGIFTDAALLPEQPVAIIFGAKVYDSGAVSPVLDQRVRAGVELYKAGKVQKLLMTGDNGRVEYDEVTAMKKRAIELGVPARDVIRDYAGFRTYDSCYRARHVFSVDRAVLVTQAFHLNRALFLARRLGIDAVGYVAEPGMPEEMIRQLEQREIGARIAAALDCVIRRKPRYLGPSEPLFQNVRDDR